MIQFASSAARAMLFVTLALLSGLVESRDQLNCYSPPVDIEAGSFSPVEIHRVAPTQSRRPLTVQDMARLRLVARIAPQRIDTRRLSVSPEGTRVAFQVYQGDPDQNKYQVAWFVAPTTSGGRAVSVGDGGESYLRQLDDGLPGGDIAALSSAKWSPDGNSIVYLRKDNEEVKVSISHVTSRTQETLRLDADVQEVFWAVDGSKLFLVVDSDTRVSRRGAQQRQADRGILLDDSYWFPMSKYPLQPPRRPNNLLIYDVCSRTTRSATPTEQSDFASLREVQGDLRRNPLSESLTTELKRLPMDIPSVGFADGRRMAFAQVLEPRDRSVFATSQLSVAFAHSPGEPLRCKAAACKGIIFSIWWSDDGDRIFFERRDTNLSNDGFYAWSWRDGSVRKIFKTSGSLHDCVQNRGSLICVYEDVTHPDTIVSLDMTTGRMTTLADLNPELANVRFTDIERLEWTSAIDEGRIDNTFGYLIKPRNFSPGRRYPLVILTKEAHGFLFSGGEYPAHVLADSGFAVLVAQEPFESLFRLGSAGRFKNDFQVRRHTNASLEAGIALLESRNLIDSNRIALTGFSDGVDITYFAMFRSPRRFATAIVSGPNWEPIGYYLLPRRMRDGISREQGILLHPDGPAPWFYDGEAPSRNVEKITAPVLHHIADSELPAALQTIVTMEEFGKVSEAYVFPDEWHQKWQPAHLLAIRLRNVQWLKFWLQGEEVEDPVDLHQYDRWRRLRELHRNALTRGSAPMDAATSETH